MTKTAIILFNLGGPDTLAAVEPFLRNLFSDKAIINLPAPFRYLLAKLLSRRRAKTAQIIYQKIGGGSPILAETEEQAAALEQEIIRRSGDGMKTTTKVFVSMRYWHPFSRETLEAVKTFAPDRIVLLPLYPQYSSTTSGSSLQDWQAMADRAGLHCPSKIICCYPTAPKFVAAHADLIAEKIRALPAGAPFRLLFSAHGLPQKIIDAGDPYQRHIEAGVAAIVAALKIADIDWSICYQSKVGPLQWIGPSTDAEIRRAGADKRSVILIPIAFVSEHSETLYELDIQYRDLAGAVGVPGYYRVPALGRHAMFIEALADLVLQQDSQVSTGHCQGCRLCHHGEKRVA